MATPPSITGHLAPSDYMVGASIVTGSIGTYAFFVESHPTIAGYLTLATTVLISLSQWLYSKGQ